MEMDFCKRSKAIVDENAFEFEIVNPEDDSTLKNIITSSDQVFSTEHLDSAIEDARNNKNTMVSAMDSIIILMKAVECEEKAAEVAKEETARCSLDILAKVDELKQEQQRAKETNVKHARELCARKSVLATEMKMRRELGLRLTSALTKKELAVKEKLEKEASCREALAYQESQMEEVIEESKILQQETTNVSKLQEFLTDRGHVVDMLNREISDKCGEVNLLKRELDQAILQSELLFSSQTCTLASSSSCLQVIVIVIVTMQVKVAPSKNPAMTAAANKKKPDSDDENSEESSSDEEPQKNMIKPEAKAASKPNSKAEEEESSDSEESSDEEVEPLKPQSVKKKASSSDEDSEVDNKDSSQEDDQPAKTTKKSALKLNGESLLDRPVKLDFAKERRAYTLGSGNERSFQEGGRALGQTLFVRGFGADDSFDNIRSTPEENEILNEISRMSIPKDYGFVGSKGAAFIDFADHNAFNKALELSGSDVGGGTKTVEVAKPRGDSREGSGHGVVRGFGGGRSGRRRGRGGRGLAKLEKGLVNLTKTFTENQPLTASEVKTLVLEIAKQPKAVEEQTFQLTEDLNKKVERILHKVEQFLR